MERAPYNDGVEISQETMAFAKAHRNEDVRELALKAHDRAGQGVDLTVALEQIAGWQTARTKLPQWAACEDIWYPPHLSMEQCSSEATARYKAALARKLVGNADQPTSLVDLTGGFGVDCSYMARCFDRAVYVERMETLCDLARHNFQALGLPQVAVVNAQAEDYLRDMEPVSLIFLDPARRDAHGSRTYAIADCTPDALALAPTLLGKAPYVMVKLSPMLDWHKAVADFNGAVAQVHIVSVANECKELLLVLDRGRHEAPDLHCVNDDEVFAVAGADGSDAAPSPAPRLEPQAGRYLYEPNASIMKAGCFEALSNRFDIQSMAPNSHLFASSTPLPDFPGRAFLIEAVCGMGKRELKTALEGLTHANITTRNFPLSPADLRRRVKLKDGGETTLFATTDMGGGRVIIRARRVNDMAQR